jgi:hypothetical protein
VANPTEYPFNPNGINIQVPIEMLDRGLSSPTAATTWARTRTSFNPADYVALSNDFFYEIIAENANATNSYTVYLVNGAGTQITDSAIIVPANTTSPKRFRVAFTPTGAADTYRVKTPAIATAGQLKVHSSRIIVQQVNAIQTKVYIPLLHGDSLTPATSDTTQAITSSSTSYSQPVPANFSWFTRNDANYDAIPATGGWTLEAVGGNTKSSGSSSFALFNRTSGLQITGAEVISSGIALSLQSATFNSNAVNFATNADVELRIKGKTQAGNVSSFYKAGLWITLKYLKKTDIHWRLNANRVGTTAAVMPHGRFYYESAWWSNPTATFMAFAQSSIASGSTVQLINGTTNETGTAGSAVTTLTPTTTYSQLSAATTIVDNNRYIINHGRTSGTATLGAAFLIINAHD